MTNYSQKFISFTDDEQEVQWLTLEAGDSHVLRVFIKKYNTETDTWELFEPDSIAGVVESYDGTDFTTESNATIFKLDTGKYKTIFTAPLKTGTFYLKITITEGEVSDLNRLKIRVKADIME